MKVRLIALIGWSCLWAGAAQASSTLIFPRVSFAPQDLTGIAIVNPGDKTATVIFTACGVDGLKLAGEGTSTAGSENSQPPNGGRRMNFR